MHLLDELGPFPTKSLLLNSGDFPESMPLFAMNLSMMSVWDFECFSLNFANRSSSFYFCFDIYASYRLSMYGSEF